MWDMNEVTEIRYLREYIYYIKVDDGSEDEVDLTEYPGPWPCVQGPVQPGDRLRKGSFCQQAGGSDALTAHCSPMTNMHRIRGHAS